MMLSSLHWKECCGHTQAHRSVLKLLVLDSVLGCLVYVLQTLMSKCCRLSVKWLRPAGICSSTDFVVGNVLSPWLAELEHAAGLMHQGAEHCYAQPKLISRDSLLLWTTFTAYRGAVFIDILNSCCSLTSHKCFQSPKQTLFLLDISSCCIVQALSCKCG